jgi:hypothetical protein
MIDSAVTNDPVDDLLREFALYVSLDEISHKIPEHRKRGIIG